MPHTCVNNSRVQIMYFDYLQCILFIITELFLVQVIDIYTVYLQVYRHYTAWFVARK